MFSIHNLIKRFGSVVAVDICEHEFAKGKTTVLLGQSGCGKSTLLRMLIGLVQPDEGHVKFEGVTLAPKNHQQIRLKTGYMIQDGGLFPHLSVLENVAIVAKQLKWSTERIDARVSELLEMTQVNRELLTRFPREISGGQRQRVALMRALFLDPPALLLDEPLGALDPIIRFEIQTQLKQLIRELGKTVVMVTHDLHEAAFLGDEVLLLNFGKIEQAGKIADFVDKPKSDFVNQFVMAQRTELS